MCVYEVMCVYESACLRAYVYVCIRLCLHTFMFAYVYVCLLLCVYVSQHRRRMRDVEPLRVDVIHDWKIG